MTPRASAGTEAFWQRQRDFQTTFTCRSPARRPVVRCEEELHIRTKSSSQLWTVFVVRNENHSKLKRAFIMIAGMVHDQSTTLITKPGRPRAEVNVGGESSVGLLFLSQFCSSWCPRRRASRVLKSCATSTQTSQHTSTPQRVLLTDSGFKSKILHANENSSTLNSSLRSSDTESPEDRDRFFQLES